MSSPTYVDQWVCQLQTQLNDFMANPSGGAERGLLELMKQYKEAVRDKLVEPPHFWRSRR
jgi:hypothetical protein